METHLYRFAGKTIQLFVGDYGILPVSKLQDNQKYPTVTKLINLKEKDAILCPKFETFETWVGVRRHNGTGVDIKDVFTVGLNLSQKDISCHSRWWRIRTRSDNKISYKQWLLEG